MSSWIKRQNPTGGCLQKPHLKHKDTRGWRASLVRLPDKLLPESGDVLGCLRGLRAPILLDPWRGHLEAVGPCLDPPRWDLPSFLPHSGLGLTSGSRDTGDPHVCKRPGREGSLPPTSCPREFLSSQQSVVSPTKVTTLPHQVDEDRHRTKLLNCQQVSRPDQWF